jgi:hypothetical protein
LLDLRPNYKTRNIQKQYNAPITTDFDISNSEILTVQNGVIKKSDGTFNLLKEFGWTCSKFSLVRTC